MKTNSMRCAVWSLIAGAAFLPVVATDAQADGLADRLKKMTDAIQKADDKMKQGQATQPSQGPQMVPTAAKTKDAPAKPTAASTSGQANAHPDVAGIALGVSDPVGTRDAITKWNHKWYSITESKGYLVDPTSDSAAAMPNTNYVKQLENFAVGADNGSGFTVFFAPPPSKNLVLHVQRAWSYGPNEAVTPERFLQSLRAKYGEQAFSTEGFPNQYIWAYGMDGAPIRMTAQHQCGFYHDFTPTGAVGNSQDSVFAQSYVKAGCGSRVWARLEVNNGVVTRSIITATDFATVKASADATDQFVANFVAAKTNKTRQDASKRTAPAL